MWTKHCQGSRCDDMGMSGTKRVPFARVWAAAVSFLFEFVGWNMENWWVFHELIGASTISTGGLDDMAQGDWNNPAKTTWKIWNDMKWHERCFPSLLKGSFMVCFTKRGHRQDGNDYDEGDLGLESLGQGVWSDTTRSQRLPKALEFLLVQLYHAHLTHMYVYCMYIMHTLIDTSMLNLGWFLLGSCSSEM